MSDEMKPHFKVVGIENTRNWNSKVTDVVGRVMSLYLFDANRHVHCAEITPSHELTFLYNQFERYCDEGSAENIALEKSLGQSIGDLEHEHGGEPVSYYHSRFIAAMADYRILDLSENKTVQGYVDEADVDVMNDDEEYEQLVERVREYLQGNWVDVRFDAPVSLPTL